jgi:hypothetical protein
VKSLIITVAAIGISAAFSVSAMTLDAYKKEKMAKSQVLSFYLGAVGEGMSWSNTQLRSEGRDPLYCEPTRLAMNGENYIQIIDDFVAELPPPVLPNNTPVEMLLVKALVKDFPCPKA